MPAARSPQETADIVASSMYAKDRASRAMGITVAEIGPGRAVLRMTVRDDMVNGHDICHGGLMATLCDSAFAFACYSYDELTVASGRRDAVGPRQQLGCGGRERAALGPSDGEILEQGFRELGERQVVAPFRNHLAEDCERPRAQALFQLSGWPTFTGGRM